MAKSTPFSEQDLLNKGFVKGIDGTYAKSTSDHEAAIKRIKSSLASKPHVFSATLDPAEENAITLNPEPLQSVLTIAGIVAGLNGSGGLMRAHWSNTNRQKKLFSQIIKYHLKEGKIRKHFGQVKVTYIGYKSSFMDWDNFGSSFKHIGDSLVAEKIIENDNPKVIVEFIPKQIKVSRKEQKVEIIIEDI